MFENAFLKPLVRSIDTLMDLLQGSSEKLEQSTGKECFSGNALIYDCEIIRCIPEKGVEPEPDLFYCEGWHDVEHMGVSCIGCYDYVTDRYRIFLSDNFWEFLELAADREQVIGFNSSAFDDKLCAANGLEVHTTYDLLCEVRVAAGQPPHYVPGATAAGYSLERLAQTNLGYGKNGSGANAAKLWQRGQYGQVADYCLGDVFLTRKILDLGLNGKLKDPNNGHLLKLREPETPAGVEQH